MFTTLAVFAPLAGAFLTLLFRPFLTRNLAVGASIIFMIISAFCGVVPAVRHLIIGVPDQTITLGSFISVGHFTANWALQQDALSLVMVAMVSVVSALIHIYSIGYMSHDRTMPRFFAYMSLFTFAMLMLVTADNLLQLFFGWEGVGLVSYLLIGYWYDRPAANAAAIKAFIVNRVGDLGFAIGIALIYLQFHSIQFDHIFAASSAMVDAKYTLFGTQFPVLEVIAMLLFIGAMGKSAQIFLHTWLADAMEGPTPISALIHAATMVAAGVFLVVRMSPLISLAPGAEDFITIIGSATALFAATVACVQTDIKRIIAYSTCSQLGYMFIAAGVGADPAAMFHLINHAFFKALLFLAAGSVIHALSDEQDIRKMGGLWRKLPVTYVVMWVGALALAAIPPFSGYYSKDVILEAAYAANSQAGMFGWACGNIAALLTAFYVSRLILMVFHGAPRATPEIMEHAHESPAVMTGPLVVLALGALSSGFLLDRSFVGTDMANFWGSSIAAGPHGSILLAIEQLPEWVAKLPLLMSLAGLGLGFLFYVTLPAIPVALAARFQSIYQFLLHKWYFDEVYDALLVRPSWRLAKFLWHVGDDQMIDGIPNGVAHLTSDASTQAIKMQTGSIAIYAFVMLIGLLALVSIFLLVR